MKDESAVRCYLNARVNVEGNPSGNLYLYKNRLRKQGIDESDPEFYNKKRMNEYIKDMNRIGWNQDPLCVEKNMRIDYPGKKKIIWRGEKQ